MWLSPRLRLGPRLPSRRALPLPCRFSELPSTMASILTTTNRPFATPDEGLHPPSQTRKLPFCVARITALLTPDPRSHGSCLCGFQGLRMPSVESFFLLGPHVLAGVPVVSHWKACPACSLWLKQRVSQYSEGDREAESPASRSHGPVRGL